MNERPLSPHLQIYRLPLTALMSVTHRVTGVLLVLGVLLFVAFLISVAEGEEPFLRIQSFLQSFVGRLFLWSWIFALFVHLCHGVRHLLWDTGLGFSRMTLTRFACLEIAASVALTAMVGMLTQLRP